MRKSSHSISLSKPFDVRYFRLSREDKRESWLINPYPISGRSMAAVVVAWIFREWTLFTSLSLSLSLSFSHTHTLSLIFTFGMEGTQSRKQYAKERGREKWDSILSKKIFRQKSEIVIFNTFNWKLIFMRNYSNIQMKHYHFHKEFEVKKNFMLHLIVIVSLVGKKLIVKIDSPFYGPLQFCH